MRDTQKEIDDDVLAVGRIDAVPVLLHVICDMTDMRFAAVSRVVEDRWTACAVRDAMQVGLKPGAELDVRKTLCREVRESRQPVVIAHASMDPRYSDCPAPKLLGVESYISVPIVLGDDSYFGNLCAADRRPLPVTDPRIVAMFTGFARLIAQQLDVKKLRAEEKAAAVGDFAIGARRELVVAMLGHDLRGPLEAIGATADTLCQRSWDPSLLEAGASIKSGVQRMSVLVDSILDYARGRLGEDIDVKFRTVEALEDMFASVVDELLAVDPKRVIVSNIAVGLPVHCDPDRLRQLTANLLSNAFSHGAPVGPVSLIVHVEGSSLLIEVWNDGEPIPAASIDRVFTPFWRHPNAEGRKSVGLGLYICAQIVRAHAGTIGVTSLQGQGTQFTARIPLPSER